MILFYIYAFSFVFDIFFKSYDSLYYLRSE